MGECCRAPLSHYLESLKCFSSKYSILAKGSRNIFEVLPALTPELEHEVFRIRHNVYSLGVKVKQIGGPVEHRGQRVPSMMDPKAIVSGMNFVTRRLYRLDRRGNR
jgi:hypothetical protein